MWGELGGGRGNLMCVPHDLHNHISLTTTANRGLSFTFLSPWQLTTPPLANTLWLGTHSGNIAGGNALQLCGLFKVGRSTLAGIAMDSVDPAVVG